MLLLHYHYCGTCIPSRNYCDFQVGSYDQILKWIVKSELQMINVKWKKENQKVKWNFSLRDCCSKLDTIVYLFGLFLQNKKK